MPGFSELFDEKVAHRIEHAIAECIKLLKQKALLEVLNTFRSLLPLYVVKTDDGCLTLMTYLGQLNGSNMFYHEKPGIYREKDPGPLPPLVEPVCLDQDEIKELVSITNGMASKNSQSDRIVVPPGFFVFQFEAQWCAGGYEDEPVFRTLIIEAPNLKFQEVIPKLKDYLSGMRENYSRLFMVYINGSWKKLKTTLHGEHHSDVSQTFDLHETEFTLA